MTKLKTIMLSVATLLGIINATILLPVSAKAAQFSYDDTMQWMESQLIQHNQHIDPAIGVGSSADYWKPVSMTWDRFGHIKLIRKFNADPDLYDTDLSLDSCTSIKESTKVKYLKGWWMAGCTGYKFPSKKRADRFSKAWNYAYLKTQQEIPF